MSVADAQADKTVSLARKRRSGRLGIVATQIGISGVDPRHLAIRRDATKRCRTSAGRPSSPPSSSNC